ncbi:hypothetical protein HYH03_004167 [Edaphochlamys debaryana]|uniref:PAS domain-containing protein n=1 Tax=Edaphochlamys debaryana TaxID=47281 RepID=A0A835YAG4_9CHLO|nr:hypothetical protein HYH03_004167 [Edaphochlamys debaryana]|eukprot:KAG2497902.1 hypothetical protein HYH03_004167 [Edaphochlamys debaryana]
MYALCVIVGLCLAGLVCLTLAMRRQEQSKGLQTAALVLHVAFEVVFFTCYTSFFDTFVFVVDCNFTGEVKHHMYFTDVMCFDMPHLLHLVVGLVFAATFLCVTALMLLMPFARALTTDLSPASKSIMATPVAYPRLKILFAKAAFVISSADLDAYSKAKAVINCLCVALILYWNVRSVPFYRKLVTCVWCGLWLGVFYTTPILLYLVFGSDHSREHYEQSTMWVLYGIFPVVVGGTGLMALYIHWVMQPAKKFLDLQQGIKLTKVHKFASPAEVELLARVMRAYDAEGELQEDAAAHGETIIKAGMQVFPNTPYLLVLYANFQLEAPYDRIITRVQQRPRSGCIAQQQRGRLSRAGQVRKDGPASRTQLQLASKHQPSIVDRYQIYCTGESSKRLRDSQDGGGMDLQAYIEFKRNFRAVLRVHKEVLLLQGELWTLMLKSVLKVSEVDKALDTLEVATARANQVYKRVLERYPNNGKLLRCYGHFLEDIRHDPIAASKAYAEAARHGGGDSIMSLDLSSIQARGAANKPDFLTSMSMEDDAVIVANAEGQIMMTSQAAQHVFGFTKQELEGANVSMLMPQPFSQRHNAYIGHYVQGGQPRMLDSVREVVGMHKDRFVFPLSLCVTKWSGMGADSVFLAVMRPLPPNALHVRVWLAPNGTVLCGDQSFASLCGMAEGEMVGRSLASLLADMEGMAGDDAANTLLERCRGATEKELQSGSIRTYMRLKHRYLEPVPVTVTCNMAGTDDQRILVLNCLRTESTINTSILVVDTRMHVRFCAASVAALLGYSARQLASMRLEQLLPAPFNALHARWLKDPPSTVTATSCRNGRVVQLVNEAGGTVPCRLKISSCASEAAGGTSAGDTLYIAQVERVPPEEPLEEKRVVVTADFNGIITSVSRPEGELFDFPNRVMTGANLCDVIDIFRDWRERNGESQLQLLILALLDKEQEMPGTSWRVRVQAPPTAGAPSLPSMPGAQGSAGTTKGPVSKSACLQVELEDVEDDTEEGDGNSTQIRLTLWRRDLLTGAAELDEGMVVRKASPMMGLIVGLPPNSMIGRPLQRILDIPPDITWEQLADSHRKAARHRSALKASSSTGVISPLMPILGPHPDSGTMRILLQGVQTASPGGHVRVAVVMHPDTAYVGAHADLMRVLRLDAESLEQRGKVQQGPQSPDASVRGLATCPEDPAEGGEVAAKGEAGDGKAERSEDEGQTTLHRKAASKSEFIAQWVRTISNNTADPDAPLAPTQPSQSPQGAPGSKPGSPLQHSRSRTLHTFREDSADGGGVPPPRLQGSAAEVGPLDGRLPTAAAPEQQPVLAKRNSGKAGAMPLPSQQAGGNRSDMGSRESEASKGQLAAADRQGAETADGEDGWEKGSEGGGSSADGSQSASSLYSATETASVSEVVVDARRSKLLKGLERVLMGPTLTEPLNRLRVHGYLILAVMLLTHIICYIVATQAIRKEDVNIYRVQRQALAMDRSQLIVVRAMRGAFCERANVSKVAACADKLDITLSKLRENIELMEQHHQYVYLGDKLMPTKLIPNVHSIWTQPQYEYQTFMDTEPPSVRMEHAGVWIMGSRYLAAAREALYWLPVIKDVYRWAHASF